MAIIFADKKKKIAAIMTGASNTPMKDEAETDVNMQILQALAKDALEAIHTGSASDLARALKAFFYQCDSMPHKEGEHE